MRDLSSSTLRHILVSEIGSAITFFHDDLGCLRKFMLQTLKHDLSNNHLTKCVPPTIGKEYDELAESTILTEIFIRQSPHNLKSATV